MDCWRGSGLRIAVAESCTGGLLGGRLTDVAGSSEWFVGGVVAYANAVKIETLGVASALIDTHGAVSEPVARAMAEGACQRLHADVGVGITGIAGPTGGTADKPVGTVVIAVAIWRHLVGPHPELRRRSRGRAPACGERRPRAGIAGRC